MKSIKSCIVIAALCCLMPAMAQTSFGVSRYTAMCSYYGETISGTVDAYESGPTAEKVVKNIMSVIGLKPNFELRASNVPNAAAVLIKSKRYILYNPNFMNKINSQSGTDWAAISILAHEIGHHLNGHTLDNVGSRPQTELEADEFSGFVLRKMGATLAEAQAVMSIIASLNGSHSHPPKKDRLTYIAAGWNNAGGSTAPQGTAVAAVANNKQTSVKPQVSIVNQATKPAVKAKPAVQQNRIVVQAPLPKKSQSKQVAVTGTTTRQPVQTEKVQRGVAIPGTSILSDAYFTTNPNGKYHITANGNLVLIDKSTVYIIASLSKSDKSGYNLMFSDAGFNSIYVASGGTLVNGNGKKVGFLKAR